MTYLIACLRNTLWDFVRYNPVCKAVVARLLWLRALLTRRHPTQRLALLARAARLCPDTPGRRGLTTALRLAAERLDVSGIDWDACDTGPTNRTDLPKAILLKPPVSPEEKGVLHVTFEDHWLRLLRSGQANAIARRYDLLLGPSSSPPPQAALLLTARLWPGRLYTLLSNLGDMAAMSALSERITPLPLLASHWVDPAPYAEYLDHSRDYDLVMLAHFCKVKRHWLLFDALRRLPRRFRVLLLGVPLSGRTEQTLRDEARAFGVADRFDLIVRPSRADVLRGLCRARASLIFSRQEGSCIAAVESLFADTPVGLFRNAHIGSKAFINEDTGRLLTRRGLARQLQAFVEEAPGYAPRAWALEHVACHRSREVLNRLLRAEALREGRPWTRDVVAFQYTMLPSYVSPETEAEMRPWNEDFARSYGLRLGPAPIPFTVSRSEGTRERETVNAVVASDP